ncbi:MAG: carbamoyl-phosphate synthase large subunit, partial [Gammaproteobacteria bacterium]
EILAIEKPKGVIVQYGGQTPLRLAKALAQAGAPIIGTSPDSIDVAEDRERFRQLLLCLDLRQPPNRTVIRTQDARASAKEIGYPLVVRPSYVLGGRAMEIVFNEGDLEAYMQRAVELSNESPVLLDRFLERAIEVDVDAVCDGAAVLIGGVMEHIEQAGVHSGDSACSLPPHSLSAHVITRLQEQTRRLARALGVIGLINVQFAIQGNEIYILEVNPRASRTVPFVSKATGLPLARMAAQCMAGRSLAAQGMSRERVPSYYSVKEAVFPFVKLPGVDTLLGPEMKSTGEVMGIGRDFGEAFAKAQQAAGMDLPKRGRVFISVRDGDKPQAVELARYMAQLGFEVVATRGTAKAIRAAGVACMLVKKVLEGQPHIVDMIKNDAIDLVVNTTEGKRAIADSATIRTSALQRKVAYTTTMAGAMAILEAIRHGSVDGVSKLQELHQEFHA